MSSINTNTSAMAALQTLRHISSGLDETKDRVSR
ncbi:flagellin-like hook-associated protein FlgL [Rhizobium leguminosarum]